MSRTALAPVAVALLALACGPTPNTTPDGAPPDDAAVAVADGTDTTPTADARVCAPCDPRTCRACSDGCCLVWDDAAAPDAPVARDVVGVDVAVHDAPPTDTLTDTLTPDVPAPVDAPPACPVTPWPCAGVLVCLATDPANCGGCGRPCPVGSGWTCCNGTCRDLGLGPDVRCP